MLPGPDSEPEDLDQALSSVARAIADSLELKEVWGRVADACRAVVPFDGMGISPAGTDVPNTGHHHLLVDVADLPDPNLPLPMTEQILHFGKGQTETQLTLPEGEHTLQLVFADYAHIPHDPVVASDRIRITVSSAAPASRD